MRSAVELLVENAAQISAAL
jgi:hypothetical protein